MTIFDDREQAFEEKFAHDEELRFLVNARRNRMIVKWAIKKAGFPIDDLEYDDNLFVEEVVNAHIEGGDEVVIRKILNFLKMAGIEMTESQIQFELDHMFVQAKKEIMEE